MKGQEFDTCDLPFDGYYAPQAERKRKPWGCPLSKHHDHKPGYVPFGGHGPVNHGHHHHHGPHHHRFGTPEDGHRRHSCGRWGPPEDGQQRPGCGRWGSKRDGDGPSEHHFHGPPGFRGDHDGRPHHFHGHGARPWWFGQRGPAESQERPWFGFWGGPDSRRP